MPSGRYRIASGGTEDFRAAPGPMGWRYFSTIRIDEPEPHEEVVDLSVDRGRRPVRVRIETGAHALRASPPSFTRDGEPLDVAFGPETELDYLSPCFNVVTASRLGRTADIDVIYFEPYTIEPVAVRQRYELLGDEEIATPSGRFGARAWRYTALDSGFTARLWIAGDVLVAYEGLYELVAYESGATGPRPV